MSAEKIRYYTSLAINKTPEYYIEIIKSNPRFIIIEINHKDEMIFEVTGPIPGASEYDKKDIKSDLIEQSIKIGIYYRDLVNKVTDDIYSAQVAEKMVYDAPMRIKFDIMKEAHKISVELDVASKNYPILEALIDYYAFIRINTLIDATNICQEYQIEKCIIR